MLLDGMGSEELLLEAIVCFQTSVTSDVLGIYLRNHALWANIDTHRVKLARYFLFLDQLLIKCLTGFAAGDVILIRFCSNSASAFQNI